MRCPVCKRWMALDRGTPMEGGADHWAEWVCQDEDCWHSERPIPTHQYDWEYCGFADEEIAAMPAEWSAPIKRERSAYRKVIRGKTWDGTTGLPVIWGE